MTREEYENEYSLLRDIHKDSNMALNKALLLLNKGYINSLEATIKAQEIIIKDKSAYMEAMAQHKTCEGCMYNRFGCDSLGYAVDCTIQFKICSRACDDCYEPKAQA